MKNLKKKVDNCFSKLLECTFSGRVVRNSEFFAFYNISSVYGLIKYFCPGGSRQSGSRGVNKDLDKTKQLYKQSNRKVLTIETITTLLKILHHFIYVYIHLFFSLSI